MKAEKTASGSWRVRVPLDPGPDGVCKKYSRFDNGAVKKLRQTKLIKITLEVG